MPKELDYGFTKLAGELRVPTNMLDTQTINHLGLLYQGELG